LHLDPRSPVLADPILAQVLRQAGERDLPGLKACPDLIEPELQSAEQRRLDGGTRCPISVNKCLERLGDGIARLASAAGEKVRRRVVERGARLVVARRRLYFRRVERRIENGGRIGDDGELRL